MIKRKKKLTKKQNQRIKLLVLATGLLICCCIVFTLLFAINKDKNIYKIESRVNEIQKEKKKDKDGYETIAWLRVQGTNIDAPIVGYKDLSTFGTIEKENFLWNDINEEKHYNQTTISGHNILNLSSKPLLNKSYFSRFDALMSFVYEDFVKENKYIQYTIDGKDYLYKVFGVYFDKFYNIDKAHEGNYDEEQMENYLTKIKEVSIYDFDIEVDSTDSIITLTTCTRFFGAENKQQIVVVGRMLREDEKIDNYEVTTTENYQEIKNILKGDDINEKA